MEVVGKCRICRKEVVISVLYIGNLLDPPQLDVVCKTCSGLESREDRQLKFKKAKKKHVEPD